MKSSIFVVQPQVAGPQGAFGQKGEKGEPAVIEPVRSNISKTY